MSEATTQWRNWLPYGDAFRFVDEILELDLPRRLVSRTHYAHRAALIGAHRVAGNAVVPGVLLGEQAAQSAFLLGRHSGWLAPTDTALLGRMNATFEQAIPGDAVVDAEIVAQLQSGGLAGFRAQLSVGGKPVARVVLAVKNMGPRP